MNNIVSKAEKSNRKEGWKEAFFFTLSFLMPVGLMVLILGNVGITYGGQVTLLTYDMQQQFAAFFASLRYILSGESSPFFTWGTALGGNYMGMIAYYMGNPLSWITVLWDLENLPDAIYVLTLLKIGLCGLTFALYTRFGLSEKRCGFANVIFSCCYAVMSYNIMYSMSLMWMDGVIFLPLILLGIEELLKGKKGIVYFASITALFFCCYYISYMVGVFAAIYVVCRILMKIKKDNWKDMAKILLRFAICTVLALGTAMPVLLPALKSIQMGRGLGAVDLGATSASNYEHSVAEVLQKFLPAQHDTIENAGLPSIYCGTVMLGLAVVFFLQRKHSVRDKVFSLVMILLPALGFFSQKLDYLWHAFRYPNSYPYRYAFLVSAMVLILAWRAWQAWMRKTDLVRILTVIFTCYTCVELFFNGVGVVTGIHKENGYSVRNAYNSFVEQYLPLVEEIKEDTAFARTEISNRYMFFNSTMLFGLNGASNFVSSYNANVSMFLYVIGGESQLSVGSARELTPLGDSLLGIKYRISHKQELNGYRMADFSEITNEIGTGTVYLHENPNALSLGYMVPEETVFASRTLTTNPGSNQNAILEALGVERAEVFCDVECERGLVGEEDRYVEFTAPSDQPLYFYVNGIKNADGGSEEQNAGAQILTGPTESAETSFISHDIEVKVITDDAEVTYTTEGRENLYLGCFEKGKKVRIEIDGEGLDYSEDYLYEMNMEQYERAISQLKERQLEVKTYQGGHITGTVTAQEGEMLFTTIPVDNGGFSVKVDGKDSAYDMVLSTFLAIPLTAGEHQIEISYTSPGFMIGVGIGAVTVILSCLYFLGKLFFCKMFLCRMHCTKRKNSVK